MQGNIQDVMVAITHAFTCHALISDIASSASAMKIVRAAAAENLKENAQAMLFTVLLLKSPQPHDGLMYAPL
jgi:hypothetical protein